MFWVPLVLRKKKEAIFSRTLTHCRGRIHFTAPLCGAAQTQPTHIIMFYISQREIKRINMYLFSLIRVCVVHCERKVILQVFEGIQWVRLGLLLKPATQKYTDTEHCRCVVLQLQQTNMRQRQTKNIWPLYIITQFAISKKLDCFSADAAQQPFGPNWRAKQCHTPVLPDEISAVAEQVLLGRSTQAKGPEVV